MSNLSKIIITISAVSIAGVVIYGLLKKKEQKNREEVTLTKK